MSQNKRIYIGMVLGCFLISQLSFAVSRESSRDSEEEPLLCKTLNKSIARTLPRGQCSPPGLFSDKEAWSPGFELGGGYLAHLGASSSVGFPTGGAYSQIRFYYWWQRFIEGHLKILYGLSGPGFHGYGGGIRVNLAQIGRIPRKLRHQENINQGLFGSGLQSILFHGDLEMTHFSFPGVSDNQLEFGLGVQWGLGWSPGRFHQCYMDTTAHDSRILGANYVLVQGGIGCLF